MLTRKTVLFSTLLLMTLAFTGCTHTSNEKTEGTTTIKIGMIAPLSGDAAAYGEQILRVMEYHLPQINTKAQLQNMTFKLIYEDGKCTGNDAVSAYQKLKDINGVKFIIGGFCSSETLALAPLTQSGEVLVVSPGSSNPAINGASPYVYSFSYSDDAIGKSLAKEMSKHKKVAIISEQNDYNIGVRDVWIKAMQQYGNVEIVANEMFPKGSSDFRVVLEKIKKTQPDALLLNPNTGATAYNLIKQLGEMQDWKEYQLYSQYVYMGDEALAAAPEVIEGMIIVDSPKMIDTSFLKIKDAIEKEKGTLSDIGSYFVADTLDVMNILTDLIDEFGNDPKAVRDALAERTFDGYIGKIHFGENNFPGIGSGIYHIKNGKAEYQE